MKNIFLLLMTSLVLSCGSTKVIRESQKTIKGQWVLNTINYDLIGTFNTKLLDDVSKECFEQSTWQFIPNNNTGTYSIANTTCAAGERYFNFTIQEIDAATGLYNFLLKPTNVKGKSDTNRGFRLKLSQLSDSAMQWQQTVNVDGQPLTISMNFLKQ